MSSLTLVTQMVLKVLGEVRVKPLPNVENDVELSSLQEFNNPLPLK